MEIKQKKNDDDDYSNLSHTHLKNRIVCWLRGFQDCNFSQLGITIIIFMNGQTNHMNAIQSQITNILYFGVGERHETAKTISLYRHVDTERKENNKQILQIEYLKRLSCPCIHMHTHYRHTRPLHIESLGISHCLDYTGSRYKNKTDHEIEWNERKRQTHTDKKRVGKREKDRKKKEKFRNGEKLCNTNRVWMIGPLSSSFSLYAPVYRQSALFWLLSLAARYFVSTFSFIYSLFYF